MGKKPKIGRPPLPKGATKEGRLFFRLLHAEVAEIEAAINVSGKTKSEWIRETLLTAARAKRL